MSGVCGSVLQNNRHLNKTDLMQMVRALGVSEANNELIAFHNTVAMGVQGGRNSLTGVAEMTVHSHHFIIAFHGNLYNLRDILPSHENYSRLYDALIRLYLKEGISFLQKLRGEFALSLWDGASGTLYLATDRFRIHPLFYYQDETKIVFSSRIKGILACPLPVELTVNPESIIDVVASSAIPTPKTIFKEIKKIPPGNVLEYRNGQIRLNSYWDISFYDQGNNNEKDLALKLKMHFDDAVLERLKVDGDSDRIGTFLSGGIDSSTLTGVVTNLNKHPVKSFSIGFDVERFNEIDYARIVARAFNAKHYEYFVTAKDTYDIIPVLIDEFDEPYANASAVPTYFCAKLARDHGVDILYAGDGGDEIFAGNERYATQRMFEYYHMIPGWLRRFIIRPAVFTLADTFNWNIFLKGKKYIKRASIPNPERLLSYGVFNVIPENKLFTEEFLRSVRSDYDHAEMVNIYYSNAPAKNDLDRQLYIDLKLAISDNDLFKVTRMTEALGIAVRFPFLDHKLAEFAASVPANIKMRGRELRSFFKNTYADVLPREVLSKTKHGFGLPIPLWLRTDKRLNDMMYDLVLSPLSIQRGYFQKKTLESIVESHKTDKTSFYGTLLWNLMMIELWHRKSKV